MAVKYSVQSIAAPRAASPSASDGTTTEARDSLMIPDSVLEKLDVGVVWQAATVTMIGPVSGIAKSASWRLQWNTSCTSPLVPGGVEERAISNLRHLVNGSVDEQAIANLRHIVNTRIDQSQQRPEALWRLPWSQDVQIDSNSAHPATTASVRDSCVELALSPHPWAEFVAAGLGIEATQLENITQSVVRAPSGSTFHPTQVTGEWEVWM